MNSFFIFLKILISFISFHIEIVRINGNIATDTQLTYTNTSHFNISIGDDVTMYVFTNLSNVNDIKSVNVHFGEYKLAGGDRLNFGINRNLNVEKYKSRISDAYYLSEFQLYVLKLRNLTFDNDGIYTWTMELSKEYTINITVVIKGGPLQCGQQFPSDISVSAGKSTGISVLICGNPVPTLKFSIGDQQYNNASSVKSNTGIFNYTYSLDSTGISITPSMCGKTLSYVATGASATYKEETKLQVDFTPSQVRVNRTYLDQTCTTIGWTPIDIGKCTGLNYEVDYLDSSNNTVKNSTVTMGTHVNKYCSSIPTDAFNITTVKIRAHYNGKTGPWKESQVNFTQSQSGPFKNSDSFKSQLLLSTYSNATNQFSITLYGNPVPDLNFTIAGEPKKLSVNTTSENGKHTFSITFENPTPSLCNQTLTYVASSNGKQVTDSATLLVNFDPPVPNITWAYLNNTCTIVEWEKIDIGRCSGLSYEVRYLDQQGNVNFTQNNITMETTQHKHCTSGEKVYSIVRASVRAFFESKSSTWGQRSVDLKTISGGPYLRGKAPPQQFDLSTSSENVTFSVELNGWPKPNVSVSIGGNLQPGFNITSIEVATGLYRYDVTFPRVTPSMCNETMTFTASANGKDFVKSSFLNVNFDPPLPSLKRAFVNGTCTTIEWDEIDTGKCTGVEFEIRYLKAQNDVAFTTRVAMETLEYTNCSSIEEVYLIVKTEVRAHYNGNSSKWIGKDVNVTTVPGGPFLCGEKLPSLFNLSTSTISSFTKKICGYPQPILTFAIGDGSTRRKRSLLIPSSRYLARRSAQGSGFSYKPISLGNGQYIFNITFPQATPSICNKTMTYTASANGNIIQESSLLQVDFTAPNVEAKTPYLNLNCTVVEWNKIDIGKCSGISYQVQYFENDVPIVNKSTSETRDEYCTNQQSSYDVSKVRLRSIYKNQPGTWTAMIPVNYTIGKGIPFHCGKQFQSTIQLNTNTSSSNNFTFELCGNPVPTLSFDIDGINISLSTTFNYLGKQKYLVECSFNEVKPSMCNKLLKYTASGNGVSIYGTSELQVEFVPPAIELKSVVKKEGCYITTWKPIDIGNCTGLNYILEYNAENVTEHSVTVNMTANIHEFCPQNIGAYNITRVALRGSYDSRIGSASSRSVITEKDHDDHWPYILGGIIGGALFLLLLLLLLIIFLCCRTRKKERTYKTKDVYHVYNESYKPPTHNAAIQVSTQTQTTSRSLDRRSASNHLVTNTQNSHIVETLYTKPKKRKSDSESSDVYYTSSNVTTEENIPRDRTDSEDITENSFGYLATDYPKHQNQTFGHSKKREDSPDRNFNTYINHDEIYRDRTNKRNYRRPPQIITTFDDRNRSISRIKDDSSSRPLASFYNNAYLDDGSDISNSTFTETPIPTASVSKPAKVVRSAPEVYENGSIDRRHDKKDIIYKIKYPADSMKQHLV